MTPLRYYDPVIGKFITADSIIPNGLFPEAFNRYSYAYNNPMLYSDPSGHFGFIEAIIIGAIVGAVSSAIQGGDFLTGAFIGGLTGAVSFGAFNAVATAAANSISGGAAGFAFTTAQNITIGIAGGIAAGVAGALTSSLAYNAAGYDVNIGQSVGIGALAGGITGGLGGLGLPTEALVASRLLVAGGMSELAGGDFATGIAYAAGTMALAYFVDSANNAPKNGGRKQQVGDRKAFSQEASPSKAGNNTLAVNLKDISDISAGFGDGLTLGGTKWIRDQMNQVYGWENAVDSSSGYFTAGELLSGAVLGNATALKAFGVGSRIAIHNAHHTFKFFGKLYHVQINTWWNGVKNSGGALRIPLPKRK